LETTNRQSYSFFSCFRPGLKHLLVVSLYILLASFAAYSQELPETDSEETETAEGVKVVSGGNTLTAKNMSYDSNQGMVEAEGEVKLEDNKGNIFYADKAKFNEDLTEGTADNVSADMNDNSKFAANKAVKESSTIMSLMDAVYSPCSLCRDGNPATPIWKINAKKVTLNDEDERVYYKHATFDLYGLPLFYTPYISHAAPGSKRKSGFLPPSYANSTTLGFTLTTPYYYNIAPNMDATIEPVFTSYEDIILLGEFRHLINSGSYELAGSITNPTERNDSGSRVSGQEIRGHIQGKGNFNINEEWSWGFDAKRSSDDTYLQRYKFGYEDVLTSKIFTNKITGRNYIGAEAISFQGLNANDNPKTTPLILPLINTHHEIPANYMGSHYEIDGNILLMDRDTGVKSRRLSSTAAWVLPHTTNSGHFLELKTSLRGDLYNIEDVVSDNNITKDGYIGRAIPEAQIGWNYPLIRYSKSNKIFLEPVAEVIYSPNGGNPDKIPNEDSQSLELSDVNVFSNNHFTGKDRVEGGFRSNYGLRGGIFSDVGDINFLLGQTYKAKNDKSFSVQSGLDDNFSDYVGRVGMVLNKNLSLLYRFRTDKDSFVMRHNEVGAGLTVDRLSVSSSYVIIDEESEELDAHEVTGSASLKLTDGWTFTTNGRRNLAENGGPVNAGLGFTYDDECLRLIIGWTKDFTRDRDIQPDKIYSFKLVLKNLGQS